MDLKDLDALLASSALPETTVPLCLRNDLQAEWEDLERQLTTLKNQPDRRLGNSSESTLAQRLRDLEDEMRAATITVRLRALRRTAFRELIEQHPPRKDNKGDEIMGVNQTSFFDALVGESIVEPEFDEERLSKLLDNLTDAQFEKLANAAWGLNRRDVDVPFSRTASRITQSSGGTSRRQSDSVSASNGSPGGNRKKSPNTTTKKAG
jgi:hypothetical protein